jgi:hypothetical protein
MVGLTPHGRIFLFPHMGIVFGFLSRFQQQDFRFLPSFSFQPQSRSPVSQRLEPGPDFLVESLAFCLCPILPGGFTE